MSYNMNPVCSKPTSGNSQSVTYLFKYEHLTGEDTHISCVLHRINYTSEIWVTNIGAVY